MSGPPFLRQTYIFIGLSSILKDRDMNSVLIVGLVTSLIASILMAYGRIFRTKHTIEKESDSHREGLNRAEMVHRLIETRIAQLGAGLLILGFSVQIIAHIFFER